jgi:asparagine synthase (glutamine-hydrolysing)
MCGIAGLWSAAAARPKRHELEAMVRALRHRGPDGSGIRVDGPIGLGHARLSIIDLTTGAQPMANEDGTVWVVFNGEIFNYLELRQQLLREGHRFRTESDTEVLVHLYEEHGDAFVHHLNGQFAFALWDGAQQRLILARDRVGIRPLFYTWSGGRLVFASEVKALFALDGVARRLDPHGLASLFTFWSVLQPRSVFEGVQTLPAGHLMIVDANGTRLRRYWDWPFGALAAAPFHSGDSVSEAERAEELRSLLVDAVRLQLRADVPVGAYLSGGLDSSIITTLIRRHTDTPLRSFSLTFEDSEFDESAYQRVLVDFLGTDHSSRPTTTREIGAAFPRVVWHAESPLVRTAPAPMMLLADSVRAAGYKVVLTGEGADEAFAGYDIFKEAKVRRWLARSPGSAWRGRLLERLYPYLSNSPGAARALSQRFFAEGLDRAGAAEFAHMPRMATTRRLLGYFRPEWRERLLAWNPVTALEAQLPADFHRWLPLERDQYVEAHTLMTGYLLSSQGDRMAMAASIEARFPFLDHRVLEFACGLPSRLKLAGLREKRLLKQSMACELPPVIGQRTKQPYRSPESASFFADGKALPYVQELLGRACLDRAGLFDASAVTKLVEKCRSGRAIGFGDNMAFVGILSTMLLHEQFVRADVAQLSFS